MGHAVIPLHSISKYLNVETWVPLQSKTGEKVSGDILIKVREDMILAHLLQAAPASPVLGLDTPKRNSSSSDL
jgi:hypothetical protein